MRHLQIVLIILVFSASEAMGQQSKKNISINGPFPTMGYLECFPPGYNDNTEKLYPLIVFAHGSGEVGTGSFDDLDKVSSWGPPSHIKNGHNMCFTVDGIEECFVVLSPQFPYADIWQIYISELLDYVYKHPEIYRIDPRRVYVTGLSRGGQFTYAFASRVLPSAYTPAAIAPISSPDLKMNGCNISRKKIAVWAFHGRLDTVVPNSMGLLAYGKVNECMDPAPTAEMKFTMYEDRYHDAWIPAYDPGHTYHDPNLYEWFLSKVRDPEAIVSTEMRKPLAQSVYPNPATKHAYIEYDEDDIVELSLHSITGTSVMSIAPGTHEIELGQLAAGVYVLHMKSAEGKILTTRLAKIN